MAQFFSINPVFPLWEDPSDEAMPHNRIDGEQHNSLFESTDVHTPCPGVSVKMKSRFMLSTELHCNTMRLQLAW